MNDPHNIANYAITGAGGHALNGHAIPALSLSGLNLRGIYDLSPKAAAEFERKYAAARKEAELPPSPLIIYGSEKELLSDSDVKGVLIATPDEFHQDTMRRALFEHGKHVLAEKPLVMDANGLKQLRAMLKDASDQSLVVTSCHPRRFDPAYQSIASWIKTGARRHGKILHIGLDFSYHKPTSAWKHGRSLLLDHACHEIDLLSFLFGTNVPLRCRILHDSFDHYQMVGSWPAADGDDPISFMFIGTRRCCEEVYGESVTVRYERGTITWSTKSGKGWACDHEEQTGIIIPAIETNYDVRGLGVMQDWLRSMNNPARIPYLTNEDLIINNGVPVLAKAWPDYDLPPRQYVIEGNPLEDGIEN